MSAAIQCDRCKELFATTPGTLGLSVSITLDASGRCDTWSDVDYCQKCSAHILEVIGPSLDDLDETLGKVSRR